MNRHYHLTDKMLTSVPHRRGDEPQSVETLSNEAIVFPTGVGITVIKAALGIAGVVFPTGVGMNRLALPRAHSRGSVPHRRGEEPYRKANERSPSVPHRRGDEP